MKKLLIALALITQLQAIEDDKVKHIMAGTTIYGGCIVLGGAIEAMGYDNPLTYKTCLIPVVVAGVGKEVYDANGNGTSEVMDAVATMAVPFSLSYVFYRW